jgi:hypothetical protein
MELCWGPAPASVAEHTWRLPDGITLQGDAPTRFGITVHRHGPDNYCVRLLWNGVHMCWDDLSRTAIMASSLPHVLRSLGTDLWYLLNQSVQSHASAA